MSEFGFKVSGKDVDVSYDTIEEMLADSWCFSASELAQIRRLSHGESVDVDLGEDGGVVAVTKAAMT
jgi:hypothetical protein